jgi:nucleotide-binding universal stress UspA family protein
MAKIFDADVYIAVIFTTNLKTMHQRVENYVDKARNILEKEKIRYKIDHFQTQNTTKTTIDFAKSIDADLIAIMTEQEDRREIGLLGPNAQQIVNHSPIPVLSMHVSDADQALKHLNNSL